MRAYKLKRACVVCGGELTIYIYREYEELICERCGVISYDEEVQYSERAPEKVI